MELNYKYIDGRSFYIASTLLLPSELLPKFQTYVPTGVQRHRGFHESHS